MTFGGRQAKSEVRGESKKGTEVVIGEAFGGEPEYIIDIPESAILATVTVERAIAASEFVERSLERVKLSPVHPDDGPYESLSCQG